MLAWAMYRHGVNIGTLGDVNLGIKHFDMRIGDINIIDLNIGDMNIADMNNINDIHTTNVILPSCIL